MHRVTKLDMGNVNEKDIRIHCSNLAKPHNEVLDTLMSEILDKCKNIVPKATKGGRPFAIHLNLREGGKPKVMAAIYPQKRTGIKIQSRKALRGFVEGGDHELPYEKRGIRHSDIIIIIDYLRKQ